MNTKKHDLLAIFLFCGFLSIMTGLYLFLPKDDFSENEKRFLEESPVLSWDAVTSGDWGNDAESYMADLEAYADMAANKTVRDDDLRSFLSELFPVAENASEREKANAKKCIDEYMICYFAPDIAKFRGTAWGAINAASDFVSHNMPHRNTQKYAENNWGRIMDGHIFLDKMAALCMR